MAVCASLSDPGQGSAPSSLVHSAEHAMATKSYARISAPETNGGASVGEAVCVGSGMSVGVLVGGRAGGEVEVMCGNLSGQSDQEGLARTPAEACPVTRVAGCPYS